MRWGLLFILTALLASILAGLLPEAWAPPDLWFLFVVAAVPRLAPAWSLVLAFIIGLFSDLTSAGYLGLHAVGLTFAAYAQLVLASMLHWDEWLGRGAVVVGAYLAKWAGHLLVVYWLGLFLVGPLNFSGVFLSEAVLTLALAPLYLAFADRFLPGEDHAG